MSDSDDELIGRRRAGRLAAGEVAEAPEELRLKIEETAAGGDRIFGRRDGRSGGEICRNILFFRDSEWRCAAAGDAAALTRAGDTLLGRAGGGRGRAR